MHIANLLNIYEKHILNIKILYSSMVALNIHLLQVSSTNVVRGKVHPYH